MQIEPFGVLVVFAGALALLLDLRWTIYFGFLFTLFGAAAATSLPSVGGATITPPTMFLGFIVVRALFSGGPAPSILEFASLRRPGGWFALAVGYGIVIALIAPGLFPETLVYSFARGDGVTLTSIKLAPLQYSSGQVTQGVYALGAVALLIAATTLLSQPGSWRWVFQAFVACATLNLVFAALDLVSDRLGHTEMLSFLRTAGYAQLYAHPELGLKRIVGSFTEASSFAAYSSVLLAFFASLWMQHFRPRLTALLALSTLIALVFSTSSTAYVVIAILFLLMAGIDLLAALTRRRPQRLGFILASIPSFLFVVLFVSLVKPELLDTIGGAMDEFVFNKLNTASGIERFQWSAQAWQTFLDTLSLGAGIGATRASGYVFTLLSNVGVIGTISFVVFAYKTLSMSRFTTSSPEAKAVGTACRWAFATGLISAAIAAGVFELGQMLYLTAAASTAIGLAEGRSMGFCVAANAGSPPERARRYAKLGD
jgi:hypothetical protein